MTRLLNEGQLSRREHSPADIGVLVMRLKDKVAVVTGAGRNIGEAIATLFSDEGAKVVVVDLDQGRADHTVGLIKNKGGAAVAVIADVSKEDSVQAMIAAA